MAMSDRKARKTGDTKVARTFGILLFLVLVGVPLVAYLWETVNQILSLEVDPTRLMISVPVAGLLYLLWRMVALWARSEIGNPERGSK